MPKTGSQNVRLSAEDDANLTKLAEYWGSSKSQVLRSGLNVLVRLMAGGDPVRHQHVFQHAAAGDLAAQREMAIIANQLQQAMHAAGDEDRRMKAMVELVMWARLCAARGNHNDRTLLAGALVVFGGMCRDAEAPALADEALVEGAAMLAQLADEGGEQSEHCAITLNSVAKEVSPSVLRGVRELVALGQ